MKNIYILSIVLFSLVSCKNKVQTGCSGCDTKTDSTAIVQFESFKTEFVEQLWQTYPGWATGLGYHKYDSVLLIPDANERLAELAFANKIDSTLARFNFNSLDANNKTDYRLIQNFTEGIRFNINEFKSYEWNPADYNIAGAIADVIDYKQKPLNERLLAISAKLKIVPAYYKAAQQNIKQPTREHVELAIMQNSGAFYFFNTVLADSLKNATLSAAELTTFKANVIEAKKAIEGYIAWLKTTYPLADSAKFRSFRIGKQLYAKKFLLDVQSKYTADEMYAKAEARKTYLHAEMKKLADELWPKYFGKVTPPDSGNGLAKVQMLINKISEQHCRRDDFLSTIEKQLPELTAFINARSIIDLDSTKPLKVRKTPYYADGVAGASINSPGPYDKAAVTYYNVTPLTGYSAAEAESYLREYNNYVLQILNIHEAIPGHFTQGIYANRSPSIVKTILGNGATVEGWACYVERMMIEEGYNPSPEMTLFYYKWNLRETCNFILDYNVHCNNWSREQVNDLLVNQAFQQSKEASGKWQRATLSQVQLTTYFTGLTEIYELRDALKKSKGKDFSLKQFHENFLSFGSAPVKEIAGLMN